MSKTNQELFEEFIEDCTVRNVSKDSIRRYQTIIGRLGTFLEERDRTYTELDKTDLKRFITHLRGNRNLSQKSMKNYFSGLNTFYEYLQFEDHTDANIIPMMRKRYLQTYKQDSGEVKRRKVISEDEMSQFLNSIINIKDKAITVLLMKTGIRRGELIGIDLKDIDWTTNSITLKQRRKRSNLIVFFDWECARILQQWLYVRERMFVKDGCDALFINPHGEGLKRRGIYDAVVRSAKRAGLYDESSSENADHFSPHNLRHCFTTYLLEHGMKREYVQELRGDARRDAVDIYNHIPLERLREAYLAAMPQFGL